jgi:hypothetical protein
MIQARKRTMRNFWMCAAAFTISTFAVGCGDDDGGPGDPDGGTGGDGSVMPDAFVPPDGGDEPDGGMVDPDAGTDAGMDAGTDSGTDAGSDAGPDADTDSGTDAGPDADTDSGTDAGPDADTDSGTDAGPDSGGGCGGGCPAGFFCEAPAGTCASDGMCVEMPFICGFIFAPVCGCDGMTYSNDCIRQSAGVSLLHDGECAPTSCEMTPTMGGCCYGDVQCGEAERCHNWSCTPDGQGVCKPLPEFGTCWSDHDCAPGETCDGARVCPCGALCILPDATGTCVTPA